MDRRLGGGVLSASRFSQQRKGKHCSAFRVCSSLLENGGQVSRWKLSPSYFSFSLSNLLFRTNSNERLDKARGAHVSARAANPGERSPVSTLAKATRARLYALDPLIVVEMQRNRRRQ